MMFLVELVGGILEETIPSYPPYHGAFLGVNFCHLKRFLAAIQKKLLLGLSQAPPWLISGNIEGLAYRPNKFVDLVVGQSLICERSKGALV